MHPGRAVNAADVNPVKSAQGGTYCTAFDNMGPNGKTGRQYAGSRGVSEPWPTESAGQPPIELRNERAESRENNVYVCNERIHEPDLPAERKTHHSGSGPETPAPQTGPC